MIKAASVPCVRCQQPSYDLSVGHHALCQVCFDAWTEYFDRNIRTSQAYRTGRYHVHRRGNAHYILSSDEWEAHFTKFSTT